MTVIGIDLGTSNSAAAVLRGGRPVIIPSAEGISLGGKAFPSYVAITSNGETLIGEPARRQATLNPEGTITAFKRLMGQRETVRLRNQTFTPEQLSAFLLQKIKRDAEAFLGETVDRAVVTVPAYFDDNQRSATKDACRIAGLEVIRLVNEPTAASLAYGLDRVSEELRIAVIDFGGGTLDVTIMEFGNGVFEVRATSGDTQLGGTDMDQRLVDYLADRFRIANEVDVHQDAIAVARLREAAEIAKIELSSSTTTQIHLPFLTTINGKPQHLEMTLTRSELEHQVRDVIERCRPPIEQALHDARLNPQQIDRLVFVGGPTRMPMVRQFFEDIVSRKAESGVDPMECVACGAAIQAGVLGGEMKDLVLVDVTPLTLGIETLGGIATALIARNTPIPVSHTEAFTTAEDMQTAVTVHVYQGERPMARDNTSLGEFSLNGLPPAPRGIPKIDVTFDIDANGILNVTALDQATKRSQSIRISGSTRLSDSNKQRMIDEAKRFAEADAKRRADADKLNAADTVCYQAEKLLADAGDKLGNAMCDELKEVLQQAREAVQNKDAQLADDRRETLQKMVSNAATQLYQQGQANAQSQPHPTPDTSAAGGDAKPTGSGPGGRVVDADFKESE